MPLIQDLGAFNTVRETGLLKLTPNVPRVTIGMGTCGRGNGAEGVFQAFADLSSRSGVDLQLAGVGCFGSCSQEPLVGIRIPGNPLLILHRVQSNDVVRIMHEHELG